MLKGKKKLILIGAKSILLLGMIITICTRSKDSEYIPEIEEDVYYLNKSISNSDSEYDHLSKLDKRILRYMSYWHIKGASLAVIRKDSLVFAKGYGWADEEKQIEMQPGHIMRMASVSKLLTAVGIMVLQDKGMLSIKDPVLAKTVF